MRGEGKRKDDEGKKKRGKREQKKIKVEDMSPKRLQSWLTVNFLEVSTVQRTFEMAHLTARCSTPSRCHHLHTSYQMKMDGGNQCHWDEHFIKVTLSSKLLKPLYLIAVVGILTYQPNPFTPRQEQGEKRRRAGQLAFTITSNGYFDLNQVPNSNVPDEFINCSDCKMSESAKGGNMFKVRVLSNQQITIRNNVSIDIKLISVCDGEHVIATVSPSLQPSCTQFPPRRQRHDHSRSTHTLFQSLGQPRVVLCTLG